MDPIKSYLREPCAYERGWGIDNLLRAGDQAPSTQNPRPKAHPRTQEQGCKSPCTPYAHVDPGTDTRRPTHIPDDTKRPDSRERTDRHALTNPRRKLPETLAHPRAYIHVYPKIRINIGNRKKTTLSSRQACFVIAHSSGDFTKQACRDESVVFSYFLYLYITIYFNVSSTLPRKNRNTGFLYIYIYI